MAPSFTRPFIVVCVLAAANSLSLVKNEALKPDGDDNQALIHSRRQQGSQQGDGNPMAGDDDVQWSDSKDPWGAMTSQAMNDGDDEQMDGDDEPEVAAESPENEPELAAESPESINGKTDGSFKEKIKELAAAHPKLPSMEIGSRNCIGSDGSHALQELSELKSLAMGDDNGISSKAFGGLPKLTSLTIGSTNGFDHGVYVALAQLTDLTSLTIGSLNRFGVDAICEDAEPKDSSATELFSKPRDLVKEEYKAFAMAKELAHVKTLFVGEKNCIGVDGAKAFGGLRRLKSPSIGSKNNIGVDGAVAFGTLEKLEHFTIGNGNAFGSKGFNALQSLTKLTSLTIGDKNSFGVDHDEDIEKRHEEFQAQCHKAHQQGEE